MHFLLICLRNLLQDIFIRDLFLMILFIFFQQTVYNLTFLQSAMSDCCKHRIPVTEPIFPLNDLLVFRLQYIDKIYRFTAAVIADQFLSTDNIIFFKFSFKPLVDLILRLRTFYNIQPVSAWSFGILGRQDFDPVTILDLIINIYKPSIHSRTDHFITDSTVDRISKIHRCGTIRQILDISVWCKAVNILLEEIQIPFQQT